MKNEGPITLGSIKSLLPLASSFVLVIVSWTSLNAKVDLTIQKLDNIAQTVQEIKDDRKASVTQMSDRVRERDDQIVSIKEELARIKTFINLGN